jgi:hypothetical protein
MRRILAFSVFVCCARRLAVFALPLLLLIVPCSPPFMHLLAGHSRFILLNRCVALAAILSSSTPAVVQSLSFSSMSFVTERDGSGTITVSPRNEADQSGLVVISHGLGDTAEGFVDVAEVSKKDVSSTVRISKCADDSPPFLSL